jgi:hypothetical protein
MINVEEGWAWDRNEGYDAFLANFMRNRMLKSMQQRNFICESFDYNIFG